MKKVSRKELINTIRRFEGYSSEVFIKNNFGDLNNFDVSSIEDFDSLFKSTKHNYDISSWDVSNARTMMKMFYDSNLDCDISSWNVSNVKEMDYMFMNSKISCDISSWNVSNLMTFNSIFRDSKVKIELCKWSIPNGYPPDFAISRYSDYNGMSVCNLNGRTYYTDFNFKRRYTYDAPESFFCDMFDYWNYDEHTQEELESMEEQEREYKDFIKINSNFLE